MLCPIMTISGRMCGWFVIYCAGARRRVGSASQPMSWTRNLSNRDLIYTGGKARCKWKSGLYRVSRV